MSSQAWLMVSRMLVFQSLRLGRVRSLPVHCDGVGCSVRLCSSFICISRGLHCGSIRTAPILKCFLFVLLQGAVDGVLDQSLADPQQLRLVRLRPATPTWVATAQVYEHVMSIITHNYNRELKKVINQLCQ